jgi:uncharacterized protein (TIGR03083 family)
MSSVYRTVAAWRHTMESILALGGKLTDQQWLTPTECPDWTVKDIYAHLVGGEQWMADGHPLPEQNFGQWAAAPVRARREVPAPAVLEELRKVYELRRMQLESGKLDPGQAAHMATGQAMPLGMLLQVRVLDAWAHEQDIRRAVGIPGNLDSPAAAIAGELFTAQLPRIVAKTAKVPPGSVIRLTTTGQVPIDVAVAVGDDGRGSLVSPRPAATVHLTMSWEAYTRLSCGRGNRDDHDVTVAGDRRLADRVLANMTTTP